jgi:hypothetical protein
MKPDMEQGLRWFLGAVVFAIGTGLCGGSWLASAQVFSPNVPACEMLPIAELEAQYSAKASAPKGTAIVGSVCSINLAGHVIKLQETQPGTEGTPTSIQMGLAGATMMLGERKNSDSSKLETKDFGNVGCIRVRLHGVMGEPVAKPISSTSCFLVQGGYLNLTMGREDGQDVSFEVVKQWLEKAGARRKSP